MYSIELYYEVLLKYFQFNLLHFQVFPVKITKIDFLSRLQFEKSI